MFPNRNPTRRTAQGSGSEENRGVGAGYFLRVHSDGVT